MKPPNDQDLSIGGNGAAVKSGSDVEMDTGEPKAKKQNVGGSKKIPDNPTERHPVQLLNEIQGGVTYNLVEEKGQSPALIFVMGTEINGVLYKGEGKNKKDAKRNCALSVLKQLYSINYPATNS